MTPTRIDSQALESLLDERFSCRGFLSDPVPEATISKGSLATTVGPVPIRP